MRLRSARRSRTERIVFVNGEFSRELSDCRRSHDGDGIRIDQQCLVDRDASRRADALVFVNVAARHADCAGNAHLDVHVAMPIRVSSNTISAKPVRTCWASLHRALDRRGAARQLDWSRSSIPPDSVALIRRQTAACRCEGEIAHDARTAPGAVCNASISPAILSAKRRRYEGRGAFDAVGASAHRRASRCATSRAQHGRAMCSGAASPTDADAASCAARSPLRKARTAPMRSCKPRICCCRRTRKSTRSRCSKFMPMK